ncbi:MAG: hypothetical protein LBB44_03735, partial [Endomicrobium sp.]|nr:hypothetical protein [Endomicrobium sp.]
MKKRVIFLCLGVLLFTCTFAFAAETKQQLASQIVNILCKDEVRVGYPEIQIFSLAIFNIFRTIDTESPVYIKNPRQIIDDALGKLPEELKQAIVDDQVFEIVAGTTITDGIKDTYNDEYLRDILRKEVVRSLLFTRKSEQEDFAKEIEFLGKCAKLLSKQTTKKEDKASKAKSGRLMNIELGRILAETLESYSQARVKALEILRQEGNLDLSNSVSFINELKESLSYAKGAQYFENLAGNEATDLKSRKKFYNQAAEEYKKWNEEKSTDMANEVKKMQERINTLEKAIDNAIQEADTLAGKGDWKAAVQKLDSALVDFNKIGQKEGNRKLVLQSEKRKYNDAIDLAKNIEIAKDIKELEKYNSQIS